MASKLSPKVLKSRCDTLFSRIIRSWGRCERCGATENLQCAHIIRRHYSATRCFVGDGTLPAAAWCLCAKCHMATEEWQPEFMALVDRTIGADALHVLRSKAEAGVEQTSLMFWRGEYERLMERCEQMGIDTRMARPPGATEGWWLP